jgi:Asp-tRNA(Asn)/Glu-tRNA(Gln) amidotransferase A subunit family amidase
MDPARLSWLNATDAARAIREGALTSEELVDACLARIREAEGQVQAWTYLDPAFALAQARALDAHRQAGEPCGPLHGVPVGIKDVIDTGDMPTALGTPLYEGRTPEDDAAVVRALRAAGAVIMGKTVTTELATYQPGKTRNPHHPDHTPGGSSSGSAAAVASGMVPLALGTQTNGSVIRPAAYCGVYGFKPTHGLIPRTGILRLSRTLDHVGAFGRTLQDVALAAQTIIGYDGRDPDTRPRATMPLMQAAGEEPPLPPFFALVRSPMWDRMDPDAREAFDELADVLQDRVVQVELPAAALGALDLHRAIMEAEMAANLAGEYDRGRDRLSAGLREQLERGRRVSAFEYQQAVARISLLNAGFEEIFERCDAVITPAAPGTAPRGLDSTGDPSFCTLWTLCGQPSVSLPLMRGENGLPLGVQLVGARGSDARLLRAASWLARRIEDAAQPGKELA